jgi:hypothetical protein
VKREEFKAHAGSSHKVTGIQKIEYIILGQVEENG